MPEAEKNAEKMELRVLPDRLAVARLPHDAPWPTPAPHTGFASITRTDAELSVVCAEDDVPAGATTIERGWNALEVVGPLDFSMIGVMSALTKPLADVGVSVFVVSTFDTDYVLVHASALETAVHALRQAGHAVHAG